MIQQKQLEMGLIFVAYVQNFLLLGAISKHKETWQELTTH